MTLSTNKRKHGNSSSYHSHTTTKRQRRDGAKQIESGMIGFFVSSTRGKERLACKEVSTLLMEMIENMYPDVMKELNETNNDNDDNPTTTTATATITSIDDEIDAEIKLLAKCKDNNHTTKYLHYIGLPIDCVFFLQLTPTLLATSINPVQVIIETINKTLLQRENDNNESGSSIITGVRTRYANRIIPFQIVCSAQYDDIVSQVLNLWNITESQTFAIYTKIREGTNTLNRDELITKVADPIIKKGNRVQLTEPNVAIVIEVYRKIAGISIIPNGMYHTLRKFNLHEVYMNGKTDNKK